MGDEGNVCVHVCPHLAVVKSREETVILCDQSPVTSGRAEYIYSVCYNYHDTNCIHVLTSTAHIDSFSTYTQKETIQCHHIEPHDTL